MTYQPCPLINLTLNDTITDPCFQLIGGKLKSMLKAGNATASETPEPPGDP